MRLGLVLVLVAVLVGMAAGAEEHRAAVYRLKWSGLAQGGGTLTMGRIGGKQPLSVQTDAGDDLGTGDLELEALATQGLKQNGEVELAPS